MAEKQCTVLNCCNKSSDKTIKFFGYPTRPERCKKWIKLTGRKDLLSQPIHKVRRRRVCSIHFEEHFMTGKKLRADAVPSLFIPPIEDIGASSDDSQTSYTQASENSHLTQIEEKYIAFGKNVVSKVQQIEPTQRMFVERIIYEAILEGQKGVLNENSKLAVNTQSYICELSDRRIRLEDPEVNLENVPAINIDTKDHKYLQEATSNELTEFRDSCDDSFDIYNSRRISEEPEAKDIPVKVEISTEDEN